MRLLLAFIAAFLLAHAACGDDDDGAGTSTTPSVPGATTATTSPVLSATPLPGETTAPPGDSSAPTEPPAETAPPPADVSILTPVDKTHSLPAGYEPPGLSALPGDYLAPGFGGSLRSEVVDALLVMLDAAYGEGHDIRCRSAYRSYAEQEQTFNYWVSVLGYEEATRVSAMPGHSEHQLGTTCDLTSPEVGWDLSDSFGETEPGRWLADHAHEYGFALSYPAGQEAATGYSYEPWHYRYIGPAEAAAFHASGLTLNAYLISLAD
jgi:D-alanyl-D-alanine carboxypeptidase